MFVKSFQGKSVSYYRIDDLTDGILSVMTLRDLLTDLFIIKSCMRHLTFKNIRREITHGWLLKPQDIRDLGKRMKITADHLSTGLKQAIHHSHEGIYIVEIMKDPSFHKYYIKDTEMKAEMLAAGIDPTDEKAVLIFKEKYQMRKEIEKEMEAMKQEQKALFLEEFKKAKEELAKSEEFERIKAEEKAKIMAELKEAESK